MLFNSYDFVFGFLPITLLVHRLLLRASSARATWVWLCLTSLVYYGWWYAPYLLLFVASLAFNYGVGAVLSDEGRSEGSRKSWLTFGVGANLALLGFYKYVGFLADNVEALLGFHVDVPHWALPIGISFFTFQQVAYLVDARRGLTKAHDVVDYVLFVSFFPQLIAGPIVHHGEMLHQFREQRRPTSTDMAVGVTMFVLGLAKKVLIADSLAPHADLVFGRVATGETPTFVAAWVGLLAFFFQVYFDFSGYSDMAVGLSRMFAVRLPINFDAPYRSDNMLEFWKRWHITLSRFLRDYLYIALGGNRRGAVRRWLNMLATMTLGGLWHGAAWTFVIWGALNGVYLLVNHAWQSLWGGPVQARWFRPIARVITLLAAMAGHTFFRAADVDDALRMLGALSGLHHAGVGTAPASTLWTIGIVFAITQFAPTSHKWLERYEPVLDRGPDDLRWPAWLTWQPSLRWGVVLGVLAFLCIPLMERASPFIYFQF